MPIDLVLEERVAVYRIKHSLEAKIGDTSFILDANTPDDRRLSDTISNIRNHVLELWQNRWCSSQKGRLTHQYLPDISSRLKAVHLTSNHYSAQLLTGHARIREKLHHLRIADSNTCRCERAELVRHIIFECPLLNTERHALASAVEQSGHNWPCDLPALVLPKTFGHFQTFSNRAMVNR